MSICWAIALACPEDAVFSSFFWGGAANGGVYLVAHVKKLLNHMAGDKPAGTRHKRYGIRHGRIRRVYRFWLPN